MELVYLWVEDYKNIQNQGFNFSPKFNCKYDPDSNELTIDENDDYIENFFGDNINVTAIVGKNGSGKSNILNAIVNANEEKFSNLLVFLGEDDKLYYKYDKDISTTINEYENSLDNFIIYLDRKNDYSPIINAGVTSLSSHEDFIRAMTHYSKIDISKKAIIVLMAVEIGKVRDSFEISTFMYLPNKISIKLKSAEELIGRHINSITKDKQAVEDYFIELSDIEHQLLIIEYLRRCGMKFDVDTMKDKRHIKEKLKEDVSGKIEEISKLRRKPKENIDISSLTEEDKGLYIRKDGYFYLIDFDLIDKEGRTYNNLSHGEQKIFGQLINIYFYAQRKNLLFLFDEPEIALHPDWQKRYMNEVITLLKKMKGKNHFILTSHSPFLLSDIPKQNIIFLDKDSEGNCKVVDGLKEKKQTFGANIHTLLSDSFFMEDGLMGEFAKVKIEEIINYLNNQESPIKNNDEAQQLISIIGEPIIRNQLQKMLDSKRLTKIDEIDEIDSIKQEIINLQNRMKEIEDADDKS